MNNYYSILKISNSILGLDQIDKTGIKGVVHRFGINGAEHCGRQQSLIDLPVVTTQHRSDHLVSDVKTVHQSNSVWTNLSQQISLPVLQPQHVVPAQSAKL